MESIILWAEEASFKNIKKNLTDPKLLNSSVSFFFIFFLNK